MSFTIATVNVNGLRAAVRKGMTDWLASTDADLVTIQEVRAPDDLLPGLVGEEWQIEGEASRLKGRAGVAVAMRADGPGWTEVRRDLPGLTEDAHSGRWLETDVADPFGDGRTLTVISCYMHSGNTEKPQTMIDKYAFLDVMMEHLSELRSDGRHVVLTGDLNIAHTEWDIKNWKGNRKSAGFLPEERAYLDRLVGPDGPNAATDDAADGAGAGESGEWIDVHRKVVGGGPGPYTWWSQRGKAFDNDSGWRIDYQLATPDLAARATSARVDRAPSYDTRWTDHAPLVVTYA
jgi:exodeoxyribonuclease-3